MLKNTVATVPGTAVVRLTTALSVVLDVVLVEEEVVVDDFAVVVVVVLVVLGKDGDGCGGCAG